MWSSSCRRIGSNAVSQVNLSFFNLTAIRTEVVGLQDEGRCVALHFEHLIMADVVVFVGNVFEQFIQERDLLKPSAVSIWFTVIVVVLGNLLKVSFVGNGNSSSIGKMCVAEVDTK